MRKEARDRIGDSIRGALVDHTDFKEIELDKLHELTKTIMESIDAELDDDALWKQYAGQIMSALISKPLTSQYDPPSVVDAFQRADKMMAEIERRKLGPDVKVTQLLGRITRLETIQVKLVTVLRSAMREGHARSCPVPTSFMDPRSCTCWMNEAIQALAAATNEG